MVSKAITAVLAVWAATALADVKAPAALPSPTRQLEWNDINFLSTSDTHGWLLGHQHATFPEPNYSGDFGDFASFVTHMRQIADHKGVDLLLVDAGDHHDGPGLVSASDEGAEEAERIFAKAEYDVLAIGNHEMYKYETAKWIYDNQAIWDGKFVTSNSYIDVPNAKGKVETKPTGELYRKWTTKHGRNVTAFGIMFDFQAHGPNLSVHPTSELATEPWFLEAIADAPDLFLLVGHQPARGETAQWMPVFQAIRRLHPLTPIFIFGGHTHERDCIQYDDRSIAVVPGRYMETVAFTSSSFPPEAENSPMKVARRYLDANRVSYAWHTNSSEEAFDTDIGRNITSSLNSLASRLDISKPLGIAPNDYFLDRYPYDHPNAILRKWAEDVLPSTIIDPERSFEKRLIIGNAGSLRADLFAGPFNHNDELTISPFATAFVYTRMPLFFARHILPQMNKDGASKLYDPSPSDSGVEAAENEALARRQRALDAKVNEGYRQSLRRQWATYRSHVSSATEVPQKVFDAQASRDLTLGYVTTDACPGRGDDILHIPVPFYGDQPDFIQTPLPPASFHEMIDVVVMDFAVDDFLTAVRKLNPFSRLKKEDFKSYAEGTTLKTVWGDYAQRFWQ